MTNLIAYNDDYGGTTFSQVTLNLIPGRNYYIKLQAFNGGAIYSRLSGTQTTTVFSALQLGIAMPISRPAAVPEFVRFTPVENGTYQFRTSPYGGTGPANDTLLELYDSASLTTPIQVNDNANGTVFSQFNHALTGGTDYYLVLRGAQAGATYANLIVEKINPMPTVASISGPGTAVYTANGSYDIFAYGVEDQISGVASVKFHTWTSLNGQDDLVVHDGTDEGNGTWKAVIPYNQHLNEVGLYITDVYVHTNGGVQALVGTVQTQVKAQGTFQYVYLSNGLLNYIDLPNGQRLGYEYDANGNLLRVRMQHP
ncbi:GBS Bsp-like repeat-containing protein [Paenibacillaceae bacterium WGS1546]|uniref:GBS Bsp-like repeat-containing protein n=1 Tax=Cohnella sp. WGS1546 TaxID=3366810 RepID=UPI00372D140E